MKHTFIFSRMRKQRNFVRPWLHLAMVCFLVGGSLNAYPPVPHHRFYGMVRDEYGHPIQTEGAEIIFETSTGRILRSPIADYYPAGTNYRLDVPMDAGLNEALYQPTAMLPDAPFRLRVKIGDQTYLPIEVAAADATYRYRPPASTRGTTTPRPVAAAPAGPCAGLTNNARTMPTRSPSKSATSL